MSTPDPALQHQLFTTRQAAHALGISITQLNYMRLNGECSPTYRLPGGRGELLWTRAEIQRLLDSSDRQRRAFRRRRQRSKYPLDGLLLVQPRPYRRGLKRLPEPPS